MRKTKYIVFDDGRFEDIVIFSELQEHRDMARGLPGVVVSAGFIQVDDDCHCYGKSLSLKVESRPERDAQLARRTLDLDS